MIKRVTGVVALTAVSLIVTAGNALAQTSTYPVSPDPSTSVEGSNGGTAFTGSTQIPVGTLMVCLFVVAGATALMVARRRAARFAG
jgi:hypothetical protein